MAQWALFLCTIDIRFKWVFCDKPERTATICLQLCSYMMWGEKGGGGAQTPCPSRTCLLCAYQTDLWQKYSEKTIFKNRGKRHTNPNWGEHTDLGLLLSNPHVWERGSFGGHRSLSKCQTQKNSLTARNLKVWVEVQMMPGEWKLPTNPTLSGVL